MRLFVMGRIVGREKADNALAFSVGLDSESPPEIALSGGLFFWLAIVADRPLKNKPQLMVDGACRLTQELGASFAGSIASCIG